MRHNQILDQSKLFLIYAIGIVLLFFGFKVENSLIKGSSILFGGILTFTHFIKTLYYYYLDGKFSYAVFSKSQDVFFKKTNKVNISKFGSNLFLCALALVLGSLFVAFKKDNSKAFVTDIKIPTIDFPETEIIPSTKIEKKLPPPPEVEKIEIPKKVEIPKVVRIVTEDYIDPIEKIEEIPESIMHEFFDLDVIDVDDIIDEVFTEIEDDFEKELAKIAREELPIIDRAEVMPTYIGGDKALLKFLYSNIKYPIMARENGIEGIVAVKFVINTDGRISHSEILRDIGGGCGTEALRVVKQMPNWIPGKQNNKNVRVAIKLPIRFKLN